MWPSPLNWTTNPCQTDDLSSRWAWVQALRRPPRKPLRGLGSFSKRFTLIMFNAGKRLKANTCRLTISQAIASICIGSVRRSLRRTSRSVFPEHSSPAFRSRGVSLAPDKDIGGYHVLWPRDMVETAMGKLASGDARAARSTLFFLRCTQEEDGGWSQNMFLDGTPHWNAVQMDGTALPILLADQLRRENALDGYDAKPMVDAAVGYLLRHGPCTEQDRWEELPGFSPYTTATEVAALLAAADFTELEGDVSSATFLRETADAWMETIDEFTYVSGTSLAEAHGVLRVLRSHGSVAARGAERDGEPHE